MSSEAPKVEPPAARPVLRRFLPLIVLLAGFAAFFALGLADYVSLQTLRENHQDLSAWVAVHAALAALVYVLAYTAIVAFSVPGAVIATLAGGFMFGTVWAGLYTVVAATLGATLVFLAARMGPGEYLRARAGPAMQKMEAGFRGNAFSYLMVLRLVPLFPFFLVNLAPAFLGVPLRTYVLATFLGIIPGTFVFASVGNGLGALFERGEEPDLGLIFEPEILLPILGLAFLSAVPILYKKFAPETWRARTKTPSPEED